MEKNSKNDVLTSMLANKELDEATETIQKDTKIDYAGSLKEMRKISFQFL